jgi:hypothetical protein
MAVCGLLVLAGLLAIVRWGHLEPQRPWSTSDTGTASSPGLVARRYLWYVTVGVVAGLGAGVLLAGAGRRLAMRLLAASAGDSAQGRVTEADQVVGRITVGGTVELIVFAAFFFSLATGLLYLLVARWLPPGRLGGLAFGCLLLVIAGTRVEPLRTNNPSSTSWDRDG